MSVKNRIDKEVLLTVQKYDKKLNKTTNKEKRQNQNT